MNEQQQAIKIAERLKKFANHVDLKERKKIYRKAARPIIKAAKENAPVYKHILRDSIKVLPILKRADAVYVGPRISKRSKKDQPFYAHWIEYGKKGYEGVRYMGRAFDSMKEVSLKLVEQGLTDAYKKAIRSVSDR